VCCGRTALIEITAYIAENKLGKSWVKYEMSCKGNEDDMIEHMSLVSNGFC